jgi:hypothetical protein
VPHHSQLGAKLGPRIAELVVDAQVDHLRKSAGTRARIEAQGKHEFWKDIAGERDAHLSQLYDLLTGHEDTHPALERALGFMSTHKGELAGMLTTRTVGTALSTGIGSGLADLLAPINQRIMQSAPNIALGVSDAVQAAVAGVWTPATGAREAARNGVNQDRFDALEQLGLTWPDFATLLDLWRRGQITESEVETALRRQGLWHDWTPHLLALKRVPLAPADAALMVLRGIIDQGEGHHIADEWGLAHADFDRLTLATGEPPAAQELMEALRRGFIDQARFDHGIRQSRIRNEWIDVFTKLRFAPMATADAVEAVVRNYISPEQGKAIAEQNGLEPSNWSTLLLAHGRPPGLGQMHQLLNRGLVSQQQVDQAIRESDIKDKYVPIVRGLRWRVPAERLIVTLVKDNAMPVRRAHELLQKEGYEPDVAAAIIKSGTAQRHQGHKELSLTMVLELYEAHALDEAQARAHILALGYPPEDVPLVLRTAELKRELHWREQAISAVRAGYLARHIGAGEAASELSALGVPSEQAAYLQRLWAIEIKAHKRTLTEAQIMHSMRQGHIDHAEAVSRLEGIGYGPNDAAFLVQSSGPIPRGA